MGRLLLEPPNVNAAATEAANELRRKRALAAETATAAAVHGSDSSEYRTVAGLYQLTAQRAADLVDHLDPLTRAEVLVSTGNLSFRESA